MPKPDPTAVAIVGRRHVDWREHHLRWSWLLDSYEGGERYRNAIYGYDRRGLPVRNLQRHKREYPDLREFPQSSMGGTIALPGNLPADMQFGPFPGLIGADPNATSADDDYELRRSRTPPPEWVAEGVNLHLSKIYSDEVKRTAPTEIDSETGGWWSDVDGRGTSIDEWMTETIAPLMLVLGQIDVLFDLPAVPDGERVETQADVRRLGLNRCVASYILPENMLWYQLDPDGRYAECLVREYVDPSKWKDVETGSDSGRTAANWSRTHVLYRHWTKKGSQLYTFDGEAAEPFHPYPFGRVPVVRVHDRKRHRSANVGKSRYEVVAELQREYYNRSSELILSDTLQAHPLLSGPEDFCKSDGTVSVGPGYLLPMKHDHNGGGYQGWEYVGPQKDPADSIRQNMLDLIESKDRALCLTKPAGTVGTGKTTVGQSGVSKQLDHQDGNKLLTQIARALARAEKAFAEYALMVCRGEEPAKDEIKVVYPSRFELFGPDELALGISNLQSLLASAGDLPRAEQLLIGSLERLLLPGLEDAEYAELDEEIQAAVDAKVTQKAEAAESFGSLVPDPDDATPGGGNPFGDGANGSGGAQTDPTGKSASTSVSNTTASGL